MSLRPIAQHQEVKRALQVVLSYLDSPKNKTPNDMLEVIVSGKSVLRGIVDGALLLCEEIQLELPPADDVEE